MDGPMAEIEWWMGRPSFRVVAHDYNMSFRTTLERMPSFAYIFSNIRATVFKMSYDNGNWMWIQKTHLTF